MKGLCASCGNWLFFKPLPDSTFSCCEAQFETIEDINLESGVSATIQMYGIEGKFCSFHNPGSSRFESPQDKPFNVHPERILGEKLLRKRLKLP